MVPGIHFMLYMTRKTPCLYHTFLYAFYITYDANILQEKLILFTRSLYTFYITYDTQQAAALLRQNAILQEFHSTRALTLRISMQRSICGSAEAECNITGISYIIHII